MFKSMCVALLLLVPTVALAQKKKDQPPPESTITLHLPGLRCSTAAGDGTFKVLAWSWGASNSGSLAPGSGGMGQTSLQDLAVTKLLFDGCSAAILTAVTGGDVLKEATLTQTSADGSKTTTLRLNGVLVTSWSLGSSISDETPTENLTLNFRELCLRDSATGTDACNVPALR